MTKYTIRPADYPDAIRDGRGVYGSGDEVVLRNGVQWFGDEMAFLGAAAGGGPLRDLDLDVYGVIVASKVAVNLFSLVSEVEDVDIYVGTPGIVVGFEHGIVLKSGEDNEIVNRGAIFGGQTGIAAGGDLRIENHGLVGVDLFEGFEATRYHAISITSGHARIVNEGAIVGVDAGFESRNQAAIKASAGATFELSNRKDGVIAADWYDDVTNLAVLGSRGGDIVRNYGEIVGGVDLGGGADVVRNRGTIDGTVDLGSGDDKVVGSGRIDGRVVLGSGDDVYDGRGGAKAQGVDGGSGDDTFIVDSVFGLDIQEDRRGGFDTVRTSGDYERVAFVERVILTGEKAIDAMGGAQAEVFRGNVRGNVIEGRGGDDAISGGRGRDVLSGGGGHDVLKGDRGDDVLEGDNGRDVLKGGRGSDTLVGGKGADKLTGGIGADAFVWRHASDSGTQRGERDVVRDFEVGRDVLVLEELDLRWQEDGFTGRHAEVVAIEKGGDTILKIDSDDDRSSDMRIVLRGVTGLGEDDLLL